jgi:hypothetical protein
MELTTDARCSARGEVYMRCCHISPFSTTQTGDRSEAASAQLGGHGVPCSVRPLPAGPLIAYGC